MKIILSFLFLVSVAQAQEVTPALAPTPGPQVESTPQGEVVPTETAPVVEAPVTQTVVTKVDEPAKEKSAFEHKAYGYITMAKYETFKTVQNLEPYERTQMDMVEFAFEGIYHLTEKSLIEFEVEIEHGGTGTTIEFDPFEEFGEFETETEKGGEVALSEFLYRRSYGHGTVLKVGRFPIPMALGTLMTKPHRIPSITASDLEVRMIPVGWNETGAMLEQKVSFVTGRLAYVNGLNSEFMRSYNWVGGGYQRRFEQVNADNMAVVANIELGNLKQWQGFGISYYHGDTTDNRLKKDKLNEPANVTIYSAMLAYKWKGLGLMGEYLQGELENSDLVSAANATLGGIAKPKAFAPLGAKAQLSVVQLSYDVIDDLTFYLKTEHVNTFADVAGDIEKYPRYEVSRRSAGVMWMWDRAAFVKAQYSKEKTELEGLPETYQATLAFGFDLSAI